MNNKKFRPILKRVMQSLLRSCKKYGVDFDEMLIEIRRGW